MYYRDVKEEMTAGLPLAINIFIRLREDILRGRMKNEEKLTEQRVCNEYNVSRTPVREAFRLLEQEDLIRMIPNRGAFVTGMTDQDIADMYDMRKEYEILAFKWAVERMTPEELENIKNAYELMEFYTMKGEVAKALNQNVHFHELIYEASHNRQLTRVLTSFQYYTKLFKEEGEVGHAEEEDMEQVLKEHREILESLEDRDAVRGAEAVRIHLEGSKIRAGYGGFEY